MLLYDTLIIILNRDSYSRSGLIHEGYYYRDDYYYDEYKYGNERDNSFLNDYMYYESIGSK